MSQDQYLNGQLHEHLKGNERATASLIQALRHPIRRYISYALSQRRAEHLQSQSQIVDDISQETFCCLFRLQSASLKAFRPESPMSLSCYVGRIAKREANNYLDRLWAVKRGGRSLVCLNDVTDREHVWALKDHGPSPEARAETEQLIDHLDTKVKKSVSSKGYCAYRLLFHQGLNTQQTSDIMNNSRAAVHSWRHRLREVAMDILEEEGVMSPSSAGVGIAA